MGYRRKVLLYLFLLIIMCIPQNLRFVKQIHECMLDIDRQLLGWSGVLNPLVFLFLSDPSELRRQCNVMYTKHGQDLNSVILRPRIFHNRYVLKDKTIYIYHLNFYLCQLHMQHFKKGKGVNACFSTCTFILRVSNVHIVTIADIRSKKPGSFGLNAPEISTV